MRDVLQLERQRVVTLIGAGGKTSTMYLLAREMVEAGKRVLVTTTTKIFYSVSDRNRFVQGNTLEKWLEAVEMGARTGDFLVAGAGVKDEKIIGVEPGWIDELARRGSFDLILVEGDGAARKPLKAPASFEPVIPASTTLVLPVMGLRVLGKPLDCELVHRIEHFKFLTGREEGVPICVEDYFNVFVHPDGYNLPELLKQFQVIPLINQVDTRKQEESALKLADLFRQRGIEMVVLTSHRYEKIVRRVVR